MREREREEKINRNQINNMKNKKKLRKNQNFNQELISDSVRWWLSESRSNRNEMSDEHRIMINMKLINSWTSKIQSDQFTINSNMIIIVGSIFFRP